MLSFNKWMSQVDTLIGARLGLSYRDMPDPCWRDMYDSGMSPDEATEDAFSEWEIEDLV